MRTRLPADLVDTLAYVSLLALLVLYMRSYDTQFACIFLPMLQLASDPT